MIENKKSYIVPFKRVLLPTDFSLASEYAIKYALSIAMQYNAQLHILHVVDEAAEAAGFYVPHLAYEKLDVEMKVAAEDMMSRFCTKNIKGIHEYASSVVLGVPYRDILKYTRENGIDIIVMGSFGKSGFDRLFFGSTTERVLRKSPCPVLIVHPPEEVFEGSSS